MAETTLLTHYYEAVCNDLDIEIPPEIDSELNDLGIHAELYFPGIGTVETGDKMERLFGVKITLQIEPENVPFYRLSENEADRIRDEWVNDAKSRSKIILGKLTEKYNLHEIGCVNETPGKEQARLRIESYGGFAPLYAISGVLATLSLTSPSIDLKLLFGLGSSIIFISSLGSSPQLYEEKCKIYNVKKVNIHTSNKYRISYEYDEILNLFEKSYNTHSESEMSIGEVFSAYIGGAEKRIKENMRYLKAQLRAAMHSS